MIEMQVREREHIEIRNWHDSVDKTRESAWEGLRGEKFERADASNDILTPTVLAMRHANKLENYCFIATPRYPLRRSGVR